MTTTNIFVIDNIRGVLQKMLVAMNHQYDSPLSKSPLASIEACLDALQSAGSHREVKEDNLRESFAEHSDCSKLEKILQNESIKKAVEAIFIAHAATHFSESYFTFKVHQGPLGSIITHIDNIKPKDLQKILAIIEELNGAITAFNHGKQPGEHLERHKQIVINGTQQDKEKFSKLLKAAGKCELGVCNNFFENIKRETKKKIKSDIRVDAILLEDDLDSLAVRQTPSKSAV